MIATLILRVKFTGLEHCEELKNHLQNSLKVRINEVEYSVTGDLNAKVNKTFSRDAKSED